MAWLCVLLLATALYGQSPPLTATVRIDASAPAYPINRMIFGGFIEHFHRDVYGGIFDPGSPLADKHGFRKDVIAALKEMRVAVVRWPGGCFASAYHWRDGVGKHRTPSFDKAWRVEDPNTFGTDEFVLWCREVGCEPYICSNAGTGTSEEMSDWVEYCNQTLGKWARLRKANGFPQPYGVKYWSIGNENYGGWEMGAKTTAEWGPLVRESAKLMHSADLNIKLLAAAQTDPNWTIPLLQQAGAQLQYVSIHGYWDPLWHLPGSPPSDYATCMMKTTRPEADIVAAQSIIEKAGFKGRIRIAYDEWNLRGWHHPNGPGNSSAVDIKARDLNDRNATYSMADAVFSASFLDACLRHAEVVDMACIAPLVNVRGPIFTYPKGIVKRPTFHVLAMYANLLGELSGKVEVAAPAFAHHNEAVPVCDAAATCDPEKRVWKIALVNRHPSEELRCTIKLGDQPVKGQHPATMLVGDSTTAYNDVGCPDRVAPEKRDLVFEQGATLLPPHSITIVTLER